MGASCLEELLVLISSITNSSSVYLFTDLQTDTCEVVFVKRSLQPLHRLIQLFFSFFQLLPLSQKISTLFRYNSNAVFIMNLLTDAIASFCFLLQNSFILQIFMSLHLTLLCVHVPPTAVLSQFQCNIYSH